MYTTENDLKKTSAIGLIALTALLVGAIVFYKARVFFADAPYLFANIVNFRDFGIQNKRYGEWITQILPYLGTLARLPLKVMLFFYAISFNLFYLAVGLVLHRLKQYALVIIMCCYYLVFVTDSFYWLSDEIHQAIAWMFLFFGVVLYMGKKRVHLALIIPLFISLLFLTIFTHFITIIPTTFLWIYLIIAKKDWPFSNIVTVFFCCCIVGIVVLKFTTGSSGYDDEHLNWIKHFSPGDAINAVSRRVVVAFFKWNITKYWVPPVILLAGMAAILQKRQIALFTWVLVSVIGYLMLMGLTYESYSDSPLIFHIETEWQPLAIIIATPFAFAFLPRLNPSYSRSIFAIIVAIRLISISTSAPSFTWRVRFIDTVVSQMKKKNIPKLAIDVNDDIYTKYILSWAASYESLLYSAIQNDTPRRTFFFVRQTDKEILRNIPESKGIITPWGMLYDKDLNKDYYIIDTTRPYQVMSYDDLLK